MKLKRYIHFISESIKEQIEEGTLWKLTEDDITDYMLEITDAGYYVSVEFGFVEKVKQSSYKDGQRIESEKEVFTDKVKAGDEVRPAYWIKIDKSDRIKKDDVTSTFQFACSIIAEEANAEISIHDKDGNIGDIDGIEIKGGLFAANVKQQMLNEKAEVEAMLQLIGNIHEPLQNSFNYTIKSSDPISTDDNNLNWNIPIEVTALTNENFVSCSKYLFNTLKALSLSSDEVSQYKSMSKTVFPVSVTFENTSITFTFRKIQSIYILQSLAYNFNLFYDEQFVITWGDSAKGYFGSKFPNDNKKQNFRVFERSNSRIDPKINDPKSSFYCVVNIPSINTVTKTFVGGHNCTLQELENMTGFSVASRGIISKSSSGFAYLWLNS